MQECNRKIYIDLVQHVVWFLAYKYMYILNFVWSHVSGYHSTQHLIPLMRLELQVPRCTTAVVVAEAGHVKASCLRQS